MVPTFLSKRPVSTLRLSLNLLGLMLLFLGYSVAFSLVISQRTFTTVHKGFLIGSLLLVTLLGLGLFERVRRNR